MHRANTVLTRTYLLSALAALALALCVILLAHAGSARAETTTTGDASVTTSTGDVTATTAATPTTATTTATDVTATTIGGQTSTGAEGLTPAPAGFAAPNPGLIAAEMGIQFWPEYDTNDVLVLLDVTLPATTVFPYEFSFFVPTGARLAGLAEIDDNGNFLYTLGTPRVTPGELMDMVTVTIPSRTVLRLEYYYDPGVGAPGSKAYTVAFQAPADVGELSVGVQQPLGSSGFSAGTVLTQTTTDSQGFTYAFGSYAGVKSGDIFQIPVAYTRSDPDPSISPGSTGSDPTQQKNSSYLLWLLIVLVLAVGGIVAYRLFFHREPAPARARSGPARAGGGARKPSGGQRPSAGKSARGGGAAPSREAGTGPARFCTQCGGRLGKKDRFCPECGTERES
ncbi:MAG: zinc ribbon domain-containing protein [Thermoleophilia bacterium]